MTSRISLKVRRRAVQRAVSNHAAVSIGSPNKEVVSPVAPS
jgi:hypothetical protein